MMMFFRCLQFSYSDGLIQKWVAASKTCGIRPTHVRPMDLDVSRGLDSSASWRSMDMPSSSTKSTRCPASERGLDRARRPTSVTTFAPAALDRAYIRS